MTTTAAGVPCWDGNASTFDTFVVACKWLQKSLKPSERSQAAPKIWQSLSGAARSVVKHLDPDDYTDDDGMTRLLNVLRASPLQQLPIPDSFGKLERWHHLRKGPNETMAQLIVKEEEMFQDLQQSLVRARADRALSHVVTPGPARMDPPSTPSQSPVAGAQRRASEQREFPPDTVPTVTLGSGGGSGSNTLANFFEDELRGYRLMKAAKLSQSERQAVLVQTQNSTHYYAIRQALRTLYAEESERSQLHDRGRSAKAWWADGEWEPEQEELELDWNEWSPTSWDQWEDEPNSFWYDGWEEDEWGYDDSWWPNEEELNPIEESEIPEERQYQEAFALANEAARTLEEARNAVKQVRAARGYYSPESSSGKGISGNKGKSKSSSGPGSGKGKTSSNKGSFGPCFLCGRPGHSYRQCPDRFSKGGKGFGKGKSKSGKGGKSPKGKGGKAFFTELYVNVRWDEFPQRSRSSTRAVIDTGATENAVGIACLEEMVSSGHFVHEVSHDSLPVFRFGNGHKSRALSNVVLHNTSLGALNFYVLGDLGATTPPLLGAKTLRAKRALLSYSNGLFLFAPEPSEPGTTGSGNIVNAVQMEALSSGHLTIDLASPPFQVESEIDLNVFLEVERAVASREFDHRSSEFVRDALTSQALRSFGELGSKAVSNS